MPISYQTPSKVANFHFLLSSGTALTKPNLTFVLHSVSRPLAHTSRRVVSKSFHSIIRFRSTASHDSTPFDFVVQRSRELGRHTHTRCTSAATCTCICTCLFSLTSHSQTNHRQTLSRSSQTCHEAEVTVRIAEDFQESTPVLSTRL